ncbi:MAG: 4Fe-4S dicluster domain-containing protein [Christensenellales bacterium]
MLKTAGVTDKPGAQILAQVRQAGVVGAGGAGFPTHVKLKARAELVIANGAECEPLLYVDQTLMHRHADRVVLGLEAAMQAVGASRGVIATKAHYHEAVEALRGAIAGKAALSLYLMDSYYPAGDEKSLIHEVTGQVVRSARLPADYGCLVLNIGTLVNIADALENKPVTDKLVTVCGDVPQAVTRQAPLGTSMREMIAATGFTGSEATHSVLEGGPLMGHLREDWDAPLSKTTGGLVVLPRDHHLILQTGMPVARQVKLAMAVCCQCNMCTIMCPRNALGLKVEPHKAMRAIANGDSRLMGDMNGVLACCSCNLCTHFACNFGLTPGTVMTDLKRELGQAGIKAKTEEEILLDPALQTKRIPIPRLIARMGLSPYDRVATYDTAPLQPRQVRLPLRQHLGQPAGPLVKPGQRVQRGQLIAAMAEGALGADLHASLSGTVTGVDARMITISG